MVTNTKPHPANVPRTLKKISGPSHRPASCYRRRKSKRNRGTIGRKPVRKIGSLFTCRGEARFRRQALPLTYDLIAFRFYNQSAADLTKRSDNIMFCK